MNKILLMLSLLVIGLFLIGCSPALQDDEALAGQAVLYKKTTHTCNDPDAKTSKDSNQLFTKSTTTYGSLKKTDSCYTSGDKTYLLEGTCNKGKYESWTKNCAELDLGKTGVNYVCESGACVKKCISGATGKWKCYYDEGGEDYWFYQKEYLTEDCSLKLSHKPKESIWCHGDCDDIAGCCGDVSLISECQGNIAYNLINHTCPTEQIIQLTGKSFADKYEDCSKNKDITGKSRICKVTNYHFNALCVSDCKEGLVTYVCKPSSKKYFKYTCTFYKDNYMEWVGKTNLAEGFDECPAGATCYNPEGKCS